MIFKKFSILSLFIWVISPGVLSVIVEEFDGITWKVQKEIRPHSSLPTITIDKSLVPEDEKNRQEELDNYFNTSILASVVDSNEKSVLIDLEYPHTLEDLRDFYVDPMSDRALGTVFPGLTLEHIPFFWMMCGRYFESLNDNWTLFSWSHFISKNPEVMGNHKKIVIYHIDDHMDMMSPLVYEDEKGLKSVVGDEPILMEDPTTIERAIHLGCIPVGAFITVFLYYYKDVNIEVRHLTKRESLLNGKIEGIKYIKEPDTLFPKRKRISAALCDRLDHQHTYFSTDNFDEFIKTFDADCTNFLHIDLDYFNDRYDGDSNWRERPRIFDPPSEEVECDIRSTINSLSRLEWSNISVAYSPAFFPSEFWGFTSKHLHKYFIV